jgi:AraC-like DNA-binding protein
MSFQLITSPKTGAGVNFSSSVELNAPQFRLYECGIADDVEDWYFGEMRSPFWCLWHLFHKGCWVESEGKRWELGPDRLMIAPAHTVYSTHNSNNAAQLWMHFSVLPDYAFEAPALFDIPLNPLLRKQLSLVRATYNGDPHVLYHHAMSLLNTCFALHPLQLRVFPEALRNILQHIETAPASDLSNANLARMAKRSLSGFVNWFESYMSQSPAAYVRDVRYQKACRMLMFSELSMEQIADKLGYPNRHYFSRIFAQRAGCGPAAFRKEHGRE